MLKYLDTLICFQEIPNEITLAINITGCIVKCPNCHSPWLAEDIGDPLTPETLSKLINQNDGITCVCFMGGDSNPHAVAELARYVKENKKLKSAWYSGKEEFPPNKEYFDYIKLGPYIKELGPLNSKTTNQKLFKHVGDDFINITSYFWK